MPLATVGVLALLATATCQPHDLNGGVFVQPGTPPVHPADKGGKGKPSDPFSGLFMGSGAGAFPMGFPSKGSSGKEKELSNDALMSLLMGGGGGGPGPLMSESMPGGGIISFGEPLNPFGTGVPADEPQEMSLSDFQSIFGGQTGHSSSPMVIDLSSMNGGAGSMMGDPYMGDIMNTIDSTLAQELLSPKGHHLGPKPCDEDEKIFCPKGKFPSKLQCLGKNADKISEKCQKDVKLSLPFNCGDEILVQGCDGVDESIITCLQKKVDSPTPGKKIGDMCKHCLEVTKSLIHKVNTLPTTVVSTKVLNDTHVLKTNTTRTREDSFRYIADWICPAGFSRDSKAKGSTSACCEAAASTPIPRKPCTAAGWGWNLIAKAGPHGGMACCPPQSSITSRTKTRPMVKTALPAKADAAAQALGAKMGGTGTGVHSPFEASKPYSEAHGRTLIVIFSGLVLIALATRSMSSAAGEAIAMRCGFPMGMPKRGPKGMPMFPLSGEEDGEDSVIPREDADFGYGAL